MTLAVVILNWNGQKLLEQFLPSIIQFSPEAIIYVADNASTDQSIAYIKDVFPTVNIIQNKANYGFATGYNQALTNVKADIYALVNSDIEVTQNWLQPIIKTFEKQPNTAVIQPKILDFKKKKKFEYAGAAGGYIDKYGYPYCRGRIFETVEEDLGQYDDETEIFWASGACFFIRSKVYHEFKGFDDDFFAHQEEIDLCWRIKNTGYNIKYNPNSLVYHVGGATLQKGNPKKTFLNFRNSLLMLSKNLPKKNRYKIIFYRMIFDGFAGLKFILEGNFKHFLAVISAHFSFYYLNLKNNNKRTNQQLVHYYQNKSIVLSYFLKNKNTYNATKN